MDHLTLKPIGYVETGKDLKFQAPHQPDTESDEVNKVHLLPGSQFELALMDLEGFDHIWLVWWFHKNPNWRPKVKPPRGPAVRRGVFATRSPHRPNPIGLTAVRLYRIEGLTLTVGPLDLVEGTPILDIKPYIPKIDSFPDSHAGWVSDVEAALANSPRFVVNWAEGAREALPPEIADRAESILQIDPSPHRTRRILEYEPKKYRLGCGMWRIYYTVDGQTIEVFLVSYGNAG